MDEIREERRLRNSESATRRQLGYLNVLGVEVLADFIKREASRLIDEAVAKESA